MRLLRVGAPNLELVEFQADPPPYAILSHRWENEEVVYNEIGTTAVIQKAGFAKIRGALEQAKQDGLGYLWVDTCCIDKTNNTELSEAINSMYRWYKQAEVCYAYLSDVEDCYDMTASKWFTRGWTLQELLAPQDLVFFSYDWNNIGTKAGLAETLSIITGIDRTILQGSSPVTSASIAQRMSWVSKRITTRTEDIAYCLLGIFDVNMPLIYGEGEKAFIRLQEQIANESDDHTLFAWTDPDAYSGAGQGLLAKHPSHFLESGHYVPCYDPQSTEPYSINKKRWKIEVRLVEPRYVLSCYEQLRQHPLPESLAVLSCMNDRWPETGRVAIGITQIAVGRGEFHRTHYSRLFQLPCIGPLTTICVPQKLSDVPADRFVRPPDYSITLCNIYKESFTGLKLIDYMYDQTVCDRNGWKPPEKPAQERSKFNRGLALRGVQRRFFGESTPNKIAAELILVVSYPLSLLRDKIFCVGCGMTADLKLGFDALPCDSEWDARTSKKQYSLIPWDGETSVKFSRWRGGVYCNFEFIVSKRHHRDSSSFKGYKMDSMYVFELKFSATHS